MINFLRKIFECKHKHTEAGCKWATRFDKPIVIDYKECKDCGRVLRCKVSFLEETPVPSVAKCPDVITLATDNKDVITGNLSAQPTVTIHMDMTANPGQNRKEAAPPEVVKEPVKMEPVPVEPPKPAPLVEAEHIEETLEKEPAEEGPFATSPDLTTPAPDGTPVSEEADEDIIEEPEAKADPAADAMVEGMCFLKESRSSIKRRRAALERRRARALERLKKTGKATLPGQKKSSIPYLDDPETSSREDEVQ